VQLLALACGAWLIVSQSADPVLRARPSFFQGVVSVLSVLGVWACAAAIAFGFYLSASLDRISKLLARAVRSSAPAMWLPPATLLVSNRTPGLAALGLILIANSARVFVSDIAPLTRRRRSPHRSDRLFGHHVAEPGFFARHTLPLILGALALQGAIFCAVAGSPLMACVLVVAGASLWAWSFARTAVSRRSDPAKLRHSLPGILLMLLLTVWISLGELGAADNTIDVWRRIAYGAPAAAEPVTRTRVEKKAVPIAGIGLVPGVILRPPKKHPDRKRVIVLPESRAGGLRSRPIAIAFSGEYHLFPASSGRIQTDSSVYTGTPLDSVYMNVGGGPMETQAYQPLDPPIDLSNCAKLQVTLRIGETSPVLASVELIYEARREDLGAHAFGFERAPEETLDFDMRQGPARRGVRAIRVLFHGDPSRRSQTTKVAVQLFTLVPRSL